NAGPFGYLGSGGSGETALRKKASRAVENCISLVFAFRTRHTSSSLLSAYSTIRPGHSIDKTSNRTAPRAAGRHKSLSHFWLGGGFGAEDALEARAGELDTDQARTGLLGVGYVDYS